MGHLRERTPKKDDNTKSIFKSIYIYYIHTNTYLLFIYRTRHCKLFTERWKTYIVYIASYLCVHNCRGHVDPSSGAVNFPKTPPRELSATDESVAWLLPFRRPAGHNKGVLWRTRDHGDHCDGGGGELLLLSLLACAYRVFTAAAPFAVRTRFGHSPRLYAFSLLTHYKIIIITE